MLNETAIRFLPLYRAYCVRRQLDKIRSAGKVLSNATNQQLRKNSLELRFRARSGEKPNRLIADAFALVREAATRTLGMTHFGVQLQAGIHLVEKRVVEMATGEGKTLTALLPLYLHALYGKGAHLATANDYLARRDGIEMKPVLELLGLSVGVVQHESDDDERRNSYRCDVTYGTLAEFGFDFLRDRMKRRLNKSLNNGIPKQAVMRGLHYVLVDEADSIMIDDASTPLIIGAFASKTDERKKALYQWAAEKAPVALERRDYTYLEHRKKVELTERGRTWARTEASNTNVASRSPVDLYEYVERAIKVERDYSRDRNYVVQNGEVTIVDENTGRLAIGRFWQDGLHQAIQAREHVDITIPTASAARLTVQSLVLSFPNRAGMTGTARSSRREFRKVYKMSVIRVPTRLRCRRKKLPVRHFSDGYSKMIAICDLVKKMRESGRPVLIGSRTVARSEALAKMFDRAGIDHEVLNARNESSEAAIIAGAGEAGRVTISTAMAGRGTDIKIDQDVAAAGGLHVVIAELNDSRRIDRQLIGRCARQGDPGSFQIFLSQEDLLFDVKNRTQFWKSLVWKCKFFPVEWIFRRAQAKVNGKKCRERAAMLYHEKKRLRALRQAGLDPVLDVVG